MITHILRKNWLIARLLEKQIAQALASHAQGLLLDAGCGNKPYACLLPNRVSGHIGIDVGSDLVGENLDVFGKVYELSFGQEVFDTVLCTEVLQYVPEPLKAMQELFRVLRPGGVVILTTTQMWHVTNPPFDCYRFTENGLRFLAEKAGFSVLSHTAIGSFWVRVGCKLLYLIHRFNRIPWLDKLILILLVGPQLFFAAMDRAFFNPKDAVNHLIILRKP